MRPRHLQPPGVLTGPPAGRLSLRVAGLEFRVAGDGCLLLPNPEPSYAPFETAFFRDGAVRTVDVRVATGPPLPLAGLERRFAAADAWSLLRDPATGADVLALAGGDAGEGAWTARLGADAVDVRCAPPFSGRRDGRTVVWDPLHYPVDQLLLTRYLGGDGVLVHAGGAALGSRGVIYAGPSGAGKTTLSRILAAAGGVRVLSDDRVVVRGGPGAPTVWGTPWAGEGGYALDEGVPLAAVLFLARGPGCRARALAPAEALRRLVPVVSIPWYDPGRLPGALAVCEGVLARVPAWELAHTPDAAAAGEVARLLR